MTVAGGIETSVFRSLATTAWRALNPGHARAADVARGADEREDWGVRPGVAAAAAHHDAAMASLTTPALLLANLIHRMGGAATSSAKGAFVNLRI